MRVLLISHTCQSRTEGQPKANRLAQFPDVELRVLTPDRWRHYGNWRPADVAGADFDLRAGRVALPWAGPAQFYLHWYPRLARLLREFRPDIIDLWEEPWGLVSAHTCWLRNRLLPQSKIISETEQNIHKTLPAPFEGFRTYTLRNADFVVGRNGEAVEIVRAKGYDGPATVVPNAVDASLFRPMDRSACRRSLGLSGFVVGYVGRLVEEKGLADAVDALKQCPPSVRLVLVGSGPYQAQLQQRAARLELSERVQFLAGRPLEQLPPLMNALDALLLPSRTTASWKEQFGRVIIEAHACGTPVIGSNSGAIPEVIGEGGLVVAERDPGALAAAITALQANPQQSREMGRKGHRQVEAQYTWEQVAGRMRDIYLQTLGRQESVLHEAAHPAANRAEPQLTSAR
jgi:glycosyltransferase involved in cell wall biosynthesis